MNLKNINKKQRRFVSEYFRYRYCCMQQESDYRSPESGRMEQSIPP